MKVAIKNHLAVLMVGVMLFGGVVFTTQQAHAQNNDEILTMINQLLEKIAVLQTLLEQRTSLEGGTKGESFSVGDEVVTTGSLKVRDDASIYGGLLKTQLVSTYGIIIAGPQTRDGYMWWKIRYNNGVTGWSASNWLHATGAYEAPTENKPVNSVTKEKKTPSCTVTTNKRVYLRGDDIKITWTSKNANYLTLVDANGEKDGLISGASDKLDTKGTMILEATVLGLPDITLMAVAADDEVYCSTVIEIQDTEKVATFQALLNNKEIKHIEDVSKNEALDMCNDTSNQYGAYNFDYGDVLECLWNGTEFKTIDQWKG